MYGHCITRRKILRNAGIGVIGAGFLTGNAAGSPEPQSFCQTTLSDTNGPPCCYSHDVSGADYITIRAYTTNGGTVDCWIKTDSDRCAVSSSNADYYRLIDDSGFELRIDNPGSFVSLEMEIPPDENSSHSFYIEIEQCTG